MSGEDVALIDLLGAARVGLSVEGEGVVEDIIVQSLFEGCVETTSSSEHHTAPHAITLNSLEGVARGRVRDEVAKVVKLVAKFDEFSAVRNVRHMLHLSLLSRSLRQRLVIRRLENTIIDTGG